MLESFSGTAAVWWMQVSSRKDDRVRQAQLVVAILGQPLQHWPLHTMTFGAVVQRLHEPGEPPYSITHASGLQYLDHKGMRALIAEAKRLRREMPEVLNQLLRRQYLLEDAPPHTAEATAWLATARELTDTEPWSRMCQMLRVAGPTQYKVHDSQLAPLVAAITARQAAVEDFVKQPYPGPVHNAQTRAASKPGRRWYTDNEYWRDGLFDGNSDPGPLYNELYQVGSTGWTNQPINYAEPAAEDDESREEEAPLTRRELRVELLALRSQLDALLERL